VVEVNPTSEGTVSYPAATSGCANPAQVPPPTTAALPPGALPSTGSNTTLPFVFAAFGLVAVGGLVLLLGRRRRTNP
jgi:LPXTG-motif cell wall-anchored protein